MTTLETLAHSYSSLKLFDNCPKRYYHERISREVRQETGEAQLHGERVHKALEKKLLKEEELPPDLDKFTTVCDKLINSSGELLPENKLALNKNFLPTSWMGDDTWLRCQIDVLVVDNSKATVLDWKTGKRRPDPFQLLVAAVMVFAHWENIENIDAGFFWLPDKKIDPYNYKRSEYEQLVRTIKLKTNRVEEAFVHDVWPAKPSGLCKSCPCRSFCLYARK
jgi:CRISPR/Cas system-associated exonuclease Cas4 (RecB family)